MSDALSRSLIIWPRELYERAGDFNDVVYPCGWVVVGDEVRIYYGSADISVSMASAKVNDVMKYILECPETQSPDIALNNIQ